MGVPGLRRTALLAAVAATVLAAAACSSGSGSSSSSPTSSPAAGGTSASGLKGTPIKVGLITSLTGPEASSTTQTATVAPAWADWMNANGGIDGHPVETIVVDDKSDPPTGEAVEQQLAADGVTGIIVTNDDVITSYDGAAIAKGIPIIGGTAYASDWYTKVGMFPTGTNIVSGLAAQVAVAAQYAHAKKVGEVYASEVAAAAQATPVLAAAAKAAGVGFIPLAVSSTAPSYTAQCLLFKQKNVDYVQLDFTTATAVRFIQDCQAQNYNPTWGDSEQPMGPAFDALPNLTMYGPAQSFPWVANSPVAATFRAAMQKYATNSNWQGGASTFTWDGLQALAQAVKNADVPASTPVTAADVTAGLYDFKGQTLGGELANPVTFTKGKPFGYTANACYFVLEMKNGTFSAPTGLTPQCPGKS
jgi:branched-chain amino acid transport system substrate-binding protein